MIKNFNGVPMLKSSEDCKKFSKSVSYETLVIGAATIGRECVQTRRLSKGSADKPLTAVGTLTSLLCNSAKVKALSFLRLRGASGAQGISAPASCREAHKRRFLFNLISGIFELNFPYILNNVLCLNYRHFINYQ